MVMKTRGEPQIFEDADLRKLLVNFRETVIYAEWSGDRKRCILRRAMIGALPGGLRAIAARAVPL